MAANGLILIIDDEEVLRHSLARILRREGYEVVTAANGAEGLRYIEDSVFDLIFLDLLLPDITGLDVLRKSQQLKSRAAVVLLTGHGTVNTAVDSMRLGATDYLLKPVDPNRLVSRTREILAEVAVQRRRQEIVQQIETLRAELHRLESPEEVQDHPPSAPAAVQGDRFLRRGRWVIDIPAQRATLDGEVIPIPPASFTYLLALIRHSPDVVDYQKLVTEAQGYIADVVEARELAKWNIYMIRQGLETKGQSADNIVTVRGVGYRLVLL